MNGNKYTIINKVGDGGFSSVYQVKKRHEILAHIPRNLICENVRILTKILMNGGQRKHNTIISIFTNEAKKKTLPSLSKNSRISCILCAKNVHFLKLVLRREQNSTCMN